MNRFGLATIVLFALYASIAAADFYKYVDDQGNVRYTDDATQVPEAQKDTALKYPGVISSAPSEAAAESDAPASDDVDDPQTVGGVQPPEQVAAPDDPVEAPDEKLETPAETEAAPAPADRKQWRQQLENEKIRLDEAYRALTEEVEAFEAEKAQAKSRDQINAYNQQVLRLNQKIEAYEKRRRDLNTQIEAFNGGPVKSEKPAE